MNRRSKRYISLGVICLLVLLTYSCRFYLLRGLGHYLDDTDSSTENELCIILSGGAYDRGNEAVKLFNAHQINRIVCVGGNKSGDLKALNLDYYESDVTKLNLTRQHVPDSLITVVQEGTSTLEEADVLLKYCRKNKIKSIMLISHIFHSHRIKQVFKKKFESSGIQFIIHGAPSSRYDENKWWESEDGLLAVSNEYLKLGYYLFK